MHKYTASEPTPYSVFVDATELHSSTTYISRPAEIQSTLAQISYYVCRLTVEEVAVRLHQELAEFLKKVELRQFSQFIQRTSVSPELSHFRDAVTKELTTIPTLQLFDPPPHDSNIQKLLFESRHKGAYKDAIVFSAAIVYAKLKSLPRCIFLTRDNGFNDLQQRLGSIYHVRVMTRDAFKDMVRFNAELYEKIISLLKPKLEEQVKLRRIELIRRGFIQAELRQRAKHDPDALATVEAVQFIKELQNENPSVEVILATVGSLGVSRTDGDDKNPPNSVTCRMMVRYSVLNLYARLYFASALADLNYSDDNELIDVQITDFDLNWMAVG